MSQSLGEALAAQVVGAAVTIPTHPTTRVTGFHAKRDASTGTRRALGTREWVWVIAAVATESRVGRSRMSARPGAGHVGAERARVITPVWSAL